MDILVSSNLERLLFYACEGDTAYVASLMKALNEDGRYTLSVKTLDSIQALFHADYCTEEETASTIAHLWHDCRWLSDTHSAVGFAVLEKYRNSSAFTGNPCIVLSTASPFKFPSTVLQAIGGKACEDEFETAAALSDFTGEKIPENIAGLREKPVLHTDVVDIDQLTDYALS